MSKPCHFFFRNKSETSTKYNEKSKHQQYFHCFIVSLLVICAFWFSYQQNIVIILISTAFRGAYQNHPFLRSMCPHPSFLFHPHFKVFQTVPHTFTQIPPALIWSTNLSWLKQISKGQIYQFNCRFLSAINFNLLNPFTNRLS